MMMYISHLQNEDMSSPLLNLEETEKMLLSDDQIFLGNNGFGGNINITFMPGIKAWMLQVLFSTLHEL